MCTEPSALKMNRRLWMGTAAAVLAAPRAAGAQANPTVHVGDAIGDPYAQGYYGMEGGFFEKAGLNVDFQSMPGGTPIGQGVITGSLDIGIMTPLAIASAVTHGVPIAIVAPGGVNNAKAPSGALIVAKNSTLRTAQDFVGKTIGVASVKTVHELMIRSWFGNNKLDPNSVKLIEMPFGEMGAAIERCTVEGAEEVDPLTSGMVKAGRVKIVDGPNAAIPEFLGAAWFARIDYARKNPDVIRRFASAMTEISRWANTHHNESGDILAKAGKMDPEAVRGMTRCSYAETVNPGQIQPLLDAATKYGILSRPVPASELIFKA
jgi:NitT/TauT family transport system substrate-binding protein